ncbi:hypothetical protein HNR29_004708 [Rhizobium leguminosarum]|nr:hypothetical protein [Rhizobium leguminosarum]
MTFELKYTQTFYEDLDRLADFLIERDPIWRNVPSTPSKKL